jgi:glycosyltransferase involved in cell wall biosynthesis
MDLVTGASCSKKLLMLTGDTDTVQGKQGPFYHTLQELSTSFKRIDVLTPKVPTPWEKTLFGNVFFHPSPWFKGFHPWYIRRKGLELHQEHHYDIVTSHDFGLLYIGWGAWALFRKAKIPWISEIHHIPGIPRLAQWRDFFDQQWLRFYLKCVQSQVSAFRVVNAIQVPQVLKSWGISESKILLLYSAYLDLEVFAPATPEKPCPKVYDLVFCGRLVPNKGLFLLLEAVKILKKNHPQMVLAVIGKGPLEASLKQYACEHQIDAQIQWCGWLPSSDALAQVYRQSKVLVCPSFHEGGPRVTLEALACGIPIVCTRVGIMNEILHEEGELGFFSDWNAIELAQKIEQVLQKKEEETPSSALTRSARCRQAVLHLSKKQTISRYAQGLLEATEKGRVPKASLPADE